MPGPASYEETQREKSILNLPVEALGESLGNRPLELAVIHLTFEGIQLFGGGVSTVARGHLDTLPRLQAELKQRNIFLTPYFLEIAYDPSHPRYSKESLKAARSKIDAMGGSLQFLPNYTQGHEPNGPWGVPELGEWRTGRCSRRPEQVLPSTLLRITIAP